MSSTAYISSEDALAYFLDFYGAAPAVWNAATSDERALALRNATRWLDIQYADRWKGTRTSVAVAQGTAWPRDGVLDADRYLVDSTTTPTAVRNACAEAALLQLAGQLDNIPSRVESRARIAEKEIAAGSVSKRVRYQGGISEAATSNRSFPLIDGLLRDLIQNESTVRHIFA